MIPFELLPLVKAIRAIYPPLPQETYYATKERLFQQDNR
jgi:hypothetical protein